MPSSPSTAAITSPQRRRAVPTGPRPAPRPALDSVGATRRDRAADRRPDLTDGVSDVIGALISILKERHKVKYNSTDPNTIIKTIAEVPITPAEAIVKTGVNLFPVIDLTERLNQLDNNPREYDDVYTGDLIISKSGEI